MEKERAMGLSTDGVAVGVSLAAAEAARRRAARIANIPYIVFIATLISQLGAGMTVKYYPLFFMLDW